MWYPSLESAVKHEGNGGIIVESEGQHGGGLGVGWGRMKDPLKWILQVGGEASSITEDLNSSHND